MERIEDYAGKEKVEAIQEQQERDTIERARQQKEMEHPALKDYRVEGMGKEDTRISVRDRGKEIGHCELTHQKIEEEKWTRIDDIQISSEHRGKGIGSETLRRAEKEALKYGSSRIEGNLSVRDAKTFEERNRLCHFYEKNGYEVVRYDTNKEVEGPIFGKVSKTLKKEEELWKE